MSDWSSCSSGWRRLKRFSGHYSCKRIESSSNWDQSPPPTQQAFSVFVVVPHMHGYCSISLNYRNVQCKKKNQVAPHHYMCLHPLLRSDWLLSPTCLDIWPVGNLVRFCDTCSRVFEEFPPSNRQMLIGCNLHKIKHPHDSTLPAQVFWDDKGRSWEVCVGTESLESSRNMFLSVNSHPSCRCGKLNQTCWWVFSKPVVFQCS